MFVQVELLLLYARWAGERLVLEKAFPRYQRRRRLISVSAVPQVLEHDAHAVAFVLYFVLCMVSLEVLVDSCLSVQVVTTAAFGHIGWAQSGHGLRARSLEVLQEPSLVGLLRLFGQPAPGPVTSLLVGGVKGV